MARSERTSPQSSIANVVAHVPFTVGQKGALFDFLNPGFSARARDRLATAPRRWATIPGGSPIRLKLNAPHRQPQPPAAGGTVHMLVWWSKSIKVIVGLFGEPDALIREVSSFSNGSISPVHESSGSNFYS